MIGKKNLGRGAVDSRAILDGSIAAADLSSGALAGASTDLDSAGLVRMADGTLTPGVTIYNNSGSTLTKGTLVYVSSYTGTNGLVVVKADADAGLEATHVIPVDIANAASGIAVETVVLTGLNTNGQTVGDAVYVSATAGGFVFTAPSGADQMVQVVGTVKVVNATTGEIEFFPGAGRITKVCTSMLQNQAVNANKLDSGMFVTYGGLAKDGSNLREAITIYNQTGGTLAVGTLLNLSGYDTTNGVVVTKADADAGIVATHVVLTAINNLSSGFVAPRGLAQNVNTNGRTIGDLVYVDNATAGGFIFTAPTGADQMVQVVGVVKVVNATTGEIVFFPGDRRITKLPTSMIQTGAVTPTTQSTAARTRIAVIPFSLPAPTGSDQLGLARANFVCSQAYNVVAVSVFSTIGTTGSDATNHFEFMPRNATGAANLHTATTSTQGGEISANAPKAITVSQNLAFTANQVFQVNVDIKDDGSAGPTNLSAADLSIVLEYTI